MKKIAVLDTETDPFLYDRIPKPFAVGYYNGESYYEFFGDDCIDLFINYLDDLEPEEKDELIVYAHNGGKFDFHFFIKYLDTDMIVINGRLAEIKICGVTFRDSYLLLPLPLSCYKKDEIDYAIFEKEERYKPKNLSEIKAYLKDDCIYLHEWLTKFAARFDNPLTLPSASFKQLKETGYKVVNTNIRYDDHFRPYYYGGRTEVFQSGVFKGDTVYFDINSAYPRAMLEWHPYGASYISMTFLPESGMYFANILAISKGALPFRNEQGFLTFPSDDIPREYFVTSWEIEAGLRTNTLKIINVIECIQHEKTYPFTDFVNKFYKEKSDCKKAGDKDGETFAKLILNSCYGKFALNSRLFKKYCITPKGFLPPELLEWYAIYKVESMNDLKEAIVFDDTIEDHQADERLKVLSWEICNDIDDFTIWQRDEPSNRFYNTATAASITGYVRAFMWETICNSEGVIYCDTDSIMCEKFHGKESELLGDWKLECVFDELYVGGKKLYTGHIKDTKINGENNWKKASKGSRLEYNEIIEIVRDNKTINWTNQAPSFSLKHGARFIDRNIKKTV